MKKLGKKNHEVIKTVEAYGDPCNGLRDCFSLCTGTARMSLNNKIYSAVYTGK